jgi:hypothetical protein
LEVEFLENKFNLEAFVRNLKALIINYKKLKVLIFKNWKWNNVTFFSLKDISNLERIELIHNKIYVVEFWSILSNLNIINLQHCTIDNQIMAKISKEFYDRLIVNYIGNYSTKGW